LKNGLDVLTAFVNQTDENHQFIDPSFGQGKEMSTRLNSMLEKSEKLEKLLESPLEYLKAKGFNPTADSAAAATVLAARVPSAYCNKRSALAYVARQPPRASKVAKLAYQASPAASTPAVVHQATAEAEESGDSDNDEWFYHASTTCTLTPAQSAVLSHLQDHKSWPSDVVLTATSGTPLEPTTAAPAAVKQEAALPPLVLSTTECVFCPGTTGHGPMTCPLPQRDRYRAVMKHNNCRMCFATDHKLSTCPYKGPCTQCKLHWHNIAICNKVPTAPTAALAAAAASAAALKE
jgi:hypothetical protein